MNLRRIAPLLLIGMLLFLSVLWVTAPLWISKAAEYMLARQQCNAVVIEIDQVGWHKSHIKRLYCNDQKNTFEIDVTDAVIRYNMAGLMEKRIEQVTLDSVVLHLRAFPEAKPVDTPVLITPAFLLEALPLSSFNIRHIVVQRQGSTGDVLQELRGYAHYSDQSLTLEMNEDTYLKGLQLKVEMDKKNGVSAALYQGKNAILHVESTIHQTDDGLLIDGTSDIKLAPLSIVLKPWLNMPKQYLEGTLHGAWQALLPAQSDKPLLQQLRASATLKLDFASRVPDFGSSRGKVNLDLKFKQGSGSWDITTRSQIKLGGKQKTTIDLSALSGSFALTKSGWRAAIAQKSDIQVKNIHIDDMLIPYVRIKVSSPVEIAKTSKGGMKIVQEAAIAMALPSLQWQGNMLSSRNLKLAIHRGSLLSPSGHFSASGIKFTSPTLKLPESNISGTFTLSDKQLSAKGAVIAAQNNIHLNWTLNHQRIAQKASLGFSLEPLRFGVEGFDLSRLIDHQGDYAIDNGTLDLNGRLQWQKGAKNHKDKLGAQFKLKLSNLKGHYKTNLFSGLSGELFFTGNENRLLMAPALVTLKRLYTGLPVNNISMSAAFTYPFGGLASVEINQFKAETLGGFVTSEKIAIDLARASNPFLVQIKHMDVGKAVEIRQQEGLRVKGLLDGNLPFDWTSEGLKMISGELKSTSAGGLIRYLGSESVRKFAATDKATKMALDILNNFHYKQLKLGADYRPDGELKMSIHLNGSNPGYENGRLVEFNFNIEENLLKLLQGLAMTGDISDALEKRVQKKLQRE